MTRSLAAAVAALVALVPSLAPAQAHPDDVEVLGVVAIHPHAFMQPEDPSLPSHVILLETIAAPSRSTPFPEASHPAPSCSFRPARVHVGARRADARTFTVLDASGARVVEGREVWQMGWEDAHSTTWRDVVVLPREARALHGAIALRGRHEGLRLLRAVRSSVGIVGSSNDLESCLGPSSAVARRFSIASGPIHVACYERGLATVSGAETPSSLLRNGRTVLQTPPAFHLIDTPDGLRLLVEHRPERWRWRALP